MRKLLFTIFILMPFVVFAAVSVDTLESYSTGDLEGKGDATGDGNQCIWSGAWGNTDACPVAWDVVSTPVFAGSRAIGKADTNTARCGRGFATAITDATVITRYGRIGQIDTNQYYYVMDGANDIIYSALNDAEQIIVLDNLTGVNLGTYVIDNWYREDFKVTNYGSKLFQAAVCDATADANCNPQWSGTNYTFFNNTAASDVDSVNFESQNNAAPNTFYMDNWGGTSTCAVASAPAKPNNKFLLPGLMGWLNKLINYFI